VCVYRNGLVSSVVVVKGGSGRGRVVVWVEGRGGGRGGCKPSSAE
jgi:hypothetical protein